MNVLVNTVFPQINMAAESLYKLVSCDSATKKKKKPPHNKVQFKYYVLIQIVPSYPFYL